MFRKLSVFVREKKNVYSSILPILDAYQCILDLTFFVGWNWRLRFDETFSKISNFFKISTWKVTKKNLPQICPSYTRTFKNWTPSIRYLCCPPFLNNFCPALFKRLRHIFKHVRHFFKAVRHFLFKLSAIWYVVKLIDFQRLWKLALRKFKRILLTITEF